MADIRLDQLTALSGASALGDLFLGQDVSDTTDRAEGTNKKYTGQQIADMVIAADAEVAAIAGLTSAADKLPYFTGSGTAALADLTSFARTLIDDANASAARTTLGLVIGTDVQAYDAELAALAGLTSAADRLPYFTGSGTAALATFTTFGRSLVDDADAATARLTLGLEIGVDVQGADAELAAIAGLTSAADKLPYFTGSGTAALADLSSFGRTLIDDASATAARATLGLIIGTQVQAYDLVLDIFATLSVPAADKFAYFTGTSSVAYATVTSFARTLLDDANAAAARTTLGLSNTRQIQFTIGDGTNPITAGMVAMTQIAYACTITRATVASIDAAGASVSGSVVVDLWKDTYANFPPTVADTITASAKPTLSSAIKSQDATLTGWTTSVAAGDYIIARVDSATTVKQIILTLEVEIA